MKTSSMARIKGALAIVPMVLALSAFGAHSSYAYDPYDGVCPSPFYSYPYHDYPPYGYPDCGYVVDGFWWSHHDHDRRFHHGRFDHSHLGHGGFHGGHGHR
jgi:hypothetical protein